ncbi:MAG: hypothetical protein AAGA56_02305 [Myxococcota bacterium]
MMTLGLLACATSTEVVEPPCEAPPFAPESGWETTERSLFFGEDWMRSEDDPVYRLEISFAGSDFGMSSSLDSHRETVPFQWEIDDCYLLGRDASENNGAIRLMFAASSQETACAEPVKRTGSNPGIPPCGLPLEPQAPWWERPWLRVDWGRNLTMTHILPADLQCGRAASIAVLSREGRRELVFDCAVTWWQREWDGRRSCLDFFPGLGAHDACPDGEAQLRLRIQDGGFDSAHSTGSR